MNKRPLCLVCLCLICFIWLFEFAGITYGGNPLQYQEFEQCVQKNSRVKAQGELVRCEKKADGTAYLYLNSTILVTSTQKFSNHSIRVKIKGAPQVSIGNQVSVTGSLYEMYPATNPGQFDNAFYYRLQGISGFMEGEEVKILDAQKDFLQDFLWNIREKAKERLLELAPKEADVLSAMLLGDKSLLEEETKINYRLIGILHILAVSGTHLAVISKVLYEVLFKIGCGRKLAGSIAIGLLCFYGMFTGSSISVIRAVLMFGVSIGAEVVGRTYDMLSAISLTAILLLVEHPGYLYDSGFLLSFGAVFGLAFLMPVMGSKWKSINGSLAVFLVQFPILQYFFFEISIFSVVINLLVIPLVPIVLGSGMLSLLVSFINLSAGRFCLIPARLVLAGYDGLGAIVRMIPWATWITGQPSFWQIMFYGVSLASSVVFYRHLKGKRFVMVVIAAMLILSVRMPESFQLTMLDVGQGDSLVLHTPTGHHYLIDGGSSSVNDVGTYRIIPYLKSQGISHLDGVFVSHGDEDHINGIMELFTAIEKKETPLRIKSLFLPRWMQRKEDQSLQNAAKRAEVEIFYLTKGDQIRDGEVVMDILHPDEQSEIYLEDENRGSMTINVKYGEFSALLTGDLCDEEEEKAAMQIDKCQVLKTAHHGSASSTSEDFLSVVQPQIALISCGKNNRYGHPAPEVLERLEDKNVQIFDTRECGAIMIKVDGKTIRIETDTVDKPFKNKYRKSYEKHK